MNWESLFGLAGQIAVAGWLILIVGPRRWRWLNHVPGAVLPAVLSLGYGVLILMYFGQTDGGFDTLASVKTLMASDPVLLAGWVHYLAFDLFVGAWIARRSDRLGLSRLIQAPVLLATFMFGPVGLMCHLLVGAVWAAPSLIRNREA